MRNQKQIIAIIPARGGSKRLHRKNILPLDGKPLLGYTIEHAIKSHVFDKIIVSTEDDEIANVAKFFGADIHHRALGLADDCARVRDVCIAVLEECFDSHLTQVGEFAVLTATSALRLPKDIINSHLLLKKGYDFVTSVSEYFFYPHAAMTFSESEGLVHFWPEIAFKKGQEIPDLFVENGAINWCRTHAFMKCKELIGPNAYPYFMPKYRSIDVDTEEDFFILMTLYEKLKKQNQILKCRHR